MKRFLILFLFMLIISPSFASTESNGLENWNNGAVKTPFTEDANPRSIYEDIDAIQTQPYFNNTDYFMWFWGLIGLGVTVILLILLCNSIDNIGTTKEERHMKATKKEFNEELSLIQNLVYTFQTAKDPEIAGCVYALMTYRDDRYNTSQIQAFLYPNEYQELIKKTFCQI